MFENTKVLCGGLLLPAPQAIPQTCRAGGETDTEFSEKSPLETETN